MSPILRKNLAIALVLVSFGCARTKDKTLATPGAAAGGEFAVNSHDKIDQVIQQQGGVKYDSPAAMTAQPNGTTPPAPTGTIGVTDEHYASGYKTALTLQDAWKKDLRKKAIDKLEIGDDNDAEDNVAYESKLTYERIAHVKWDSTAEQMLALLMKAPDRSQPEILSAYKTAQLRKTVSLQIGEYVYIQPTHSNISEVKFRAALERLKKVGDMSNLTKDFSELAFTQAATVLDKSSTVDTVLRLNVDSPIQNMSEAIKANSRP